MQSWVSHEVHEPQSAVQAMIASDSAAACLSSSGAQGMWPLKNLTVRLGTFAEMSSAARSSAVSPLAFAFHSRPSVLPSSDSKRGANENEPSPYFSAVGFTTLNVCVT